MTRRSLIPAQTRTHAWGRGLSILFLCVGLGVVILLAYMGYPTYAVWGISFLLIVFAGLRALLPGRPWFSSRNKPMDVLVMVALAIALAWAAQFATIAPA